MVYDSELCDNDFIREALETIGKMNNMALDNYCSTLMKVRTQQARSNKLDSFKHRPLELVYHLSSLLKFIKLKWHILI